MSRGEETRGAVGLGVENAQFGESLQRVGKKRDGVAKWMGSQSPSHVQSSSGNVVYEVAFD